MAILPRNILKTFFQKNDIPTESQFGSLIDSAFNLTEDRKLLGLKKYDSTVTYAVGDSAVKDGLIYEAIAVTTGPFDNTKWVKLTFGPLNYAGTWDASTNVNPTLTSSVGNLGDYYVVRTAGTTNLNGINSWDARDWVVFNGSVWEKVDNTEAGVAASLVTYDNAVSGMLATDVQDAIDELDVRLDTVETDIGSLQTNKADVTALNAHTADTNNPHGVTKTQVGLGNVDNTSDADKPVSTAQQVALNAKQAASVNLDNLAGVELLEGQIIQQKNGAATAVEPTIFKSDLLLTKSDVGLANVDNTSDANKPVSTAQQTALDLKTDLTAFNAHTADTTNPHAVTKTQVGLANVDNTSDLGKPVSTAQQAALDLKTDLTAFNAHTADTTNPHAVTKAQVGLGNVDNTSDLGKPVSTAQQAALDLKTDLTAFNAHTANTSNPHAVTKAQVGLGNVDNTSDLGKPVSTAQQAALDLKTDLTAFNAHTANTSNPHSVTKAQIGLGNVTDDKQMSHKSYSSDEEGTFPTTTTPTFSGANTYSGSFETEASTDYMIEWYCELSTSTSGGSGGIRFDLDTVVLSQDERAIGLSDVFTTITGFMLVTGLESGFHSFRIYYNCPNGVGTTTFRRPRVRVTKL